MSAARHVHPGTGGFDLAGRLDEVDRVVVVLFNTGCHSKYVGVKNDVGWVKADGFHQ